MKSASRKSWYNHQVMSTGRSFKFFETFVEPTMLYGCKMWIYTIWIPPPHPRIVSGWYPAVTLVVHLLQIQEVHPGPHSNACNFLSFLSIFSYLSYLGHTSLLGLQIRPEYIVVESWELDKANLDVPLFARGTFCERLRSACTKTFTTELMDVSGL